MTRMPNPALVNASEFPALALPFTADPRRAGWTAFAKATFEIGADGALRLAENQLPVAPTDLHAGDPLETSCRYESDLVPFKPRADVLCVGNAYPNRGKPGPNCIVALGVGSWQKQILVIGNRTWVASGGGKWNTPTPPEPFVAMPITYENAFGGRDPADPQKLRAFAQNPIGKGYASVETSLGGLRLPNLEDPSNPMRSPKDQVPPRAFGPVGRTWQPRLARAGTFDKRWVEGGAPVLPEDFDEAYYNCAPADQQIQGYLRGDEKVRVKNMHPVQADLAFDLPGLRVRCLADRAREGSRQLEDVPTHLDTLWLDTEALLLVLVWRARLPVPAAEGVTHLLVVSEPLQTPAAPPESFRHEVDAFEASDAEPEPPEIEPTEVAAPVPDIED